MHSKSKFAITFSIASLLFILANPGTSQALQRLSASEIRDELFGAHIFGEHAFAGFVFDECIEPSGLTVYRHHFDQPNKGTVERGRLTTDEANRACFTYPPEGDPDPACFAVFRKGDGYVFQGDFDESRYVIDQVMRPVRACSTDPALF